MEFGASPTKRPLLDLDPDYKDGHISEAKRRCLVEETGQEQAQQRVVEVVVRQLDAALAQKENEVLHLQENVQTCQRILHMLRFGVTSAYYRNYLPSDDPSESAQNEEQNSLHPAVLRLLGYPVANGPKTRHIHYKSTSLVEGTSDQEAADRITRATSMKYTDEEEEEEGDDEEEGEEDDDDDDDYSDDHNDSEEVQEEKEEPVSLKVPRYVPPILPAPPEVCAASVRMERHRIKRRLVVGNVSKWLPEDLREGAASHKWMLYLRGPKDSPNISDIIAKVRYFLHPSYRPHDIVDVVHPFYLARRGWGEFPVRVQVHFSLAGNRPIDIIHNLKLDRTYSGLQTLGGETVVDVWLKNTQMDHCAGYSNVVNCQEETEKNLPMLPQSTFYSDSQHVRQRQLAVTIKQEQEEEDDDDDDDDEDDDYDDDGSGDEEEEEEEEENKDEDRKEFQQDDKNVTVYDDPQECPADNKLDHNFETIQVKYENDQIQSYAQSSACFSHEVCSETYVASPVNGFVFHTLPDHDYLGTNTFRLKCESCVEQINPNGIVENGLLKAQMVQKAVIPSEYGEILVKTEKMEDFTKVDGYYSESSTPRNGIVSDMSIVQCVDAEGKLLYISLQKPTTKGDLRKGMLANSSEAKLQHPKSDSVVNNITNLSVVGTKVTNKIFQKNVTLPSPSLQVGQSLLKKNCLGPLSSVPLDSSNSVEVTQRKLTLERPHTHLDMFKELDAQLTEATHTVSRITDDRLAVTWLLRQLPLVDARVNKVPEFKRLRPYCANSIDVFLAWPVGKRHCAERLRANAAHAILQKSNPSRFAKWSVRHIMKWSRLHALTPLPAVDLPREQMEDLPAICSSLRHTLSEPSEVQDWLESVSEASKTAEEMEIVDVEELTPSSTGSKTSLYLQETPNSVMWMHSNAPLSEFLHDTAEQLDIRLVPEMLCPGVLYPAVEELLYKACESLCEDLLRRSVRQAWRRCKQMPNEILLRDVQDALLTRSELDVFTNSGLGVQAYNSSKYS